ncbi:MAG: tetratricopeptide repeat protein [Armatimonadetes bacterium]|nr:tetratricopeptide repeat protein [Armatimonadota bacterium]
MRRSVLIASITIVAVVLGLAVAMFAVAPADSEKYAYRGNRFDRFIKESYACVRPNKPGSFYVWMDKAYSASPNRYPGRQAFNLEELLAWERGQLARITDPAKKTQAEIDLGAWLHKMVKGIIPRFSLDRGFEFCNVVAYGERQCFLQSVLIAGLMQRMGMDAGVEMVWKSITGQESNNGHAVVLVKLPNGQDIIVDASEPEPFARQQGLFVRLTDYRYVNPIYAKDSAKILYYKSTSNGAKISNMNVRTLDYDFLRSQFYYYRGERAPGGFLAQKRTKQGLETAEKALRTSVKLCPNNPLAVYFLGRVYYAQGNIAASRRQALLAEKLYHRFGWEPSGERELLALTGGR